MSLHYLGKREPQKLCRFSHAGYSPRPPTSSDRNKIFHDGWSSGGSSEVRILSKLDKWFRSCEGSKFALSPLIWPFSHTLGLINGKQQISTPQLQSRLTDLYLCYVTRSGMTDAAHINKDAPNVMFNI